MYIHLASQLVEHKVSGKSRQMSISRAQVSLRTFTVEGRDIQKLRFFNSLTLFQLGKNKFITVTLYKY